MAKTLQQFLSEEPPTSKPASCGHILDVLDKEGNYKIKGNHVCQDCYFEKLGELIEEQTPHGGCH